MEDEIGLMGAVADDVEAALRQKVWETKVGGYGIRMLEPLIVTVHGYQVPLFTQSVLYSGARKRLSSRIS